MEVEGNASETIDEQENEENMDEAGGEGADSSDSEDSDGNEAVHDPRIQQLELQVVYPCTLACVQLSVCLTFTHCTKNLVELFFLLYIS